MSAFRRVPYVVACVMLATFPLSVFAESYDLSLSASDVSFKPVRALVNQLDEVTITVSNLGTQDAEGVVQLFDGETIVSSKSVSVKADGRQDDVWMNWRPSTVGLHTLHIHLISDVNTRDENLSNNTVDMSVVVDGDQDGDGIGDAVDPDIDGDGVPNAQDAFPFDPTRWAVPVPTPVVTPVPVRPAIAVSPIVSPKAPIVSKKPVTPIVVPKSTKEPVTKLLAASSVAPSTTVASPDVQTTTTPLMAATTTSTQPVIKQDQKKVIAPPIDGGSTPFAFYLLGGAAFVSVACGFIFLSRSASV